MRQLYVYMNETKAGVLTEISPNQGYSFVYDEKYLQSSFPPISINLPKRKEEYLSDNLFPFFMNLLPEGANRRIICRGYKIDEQDYFGLLMVMADQDFIGAVSVRKIYEDNNT